MRKMVKKAVLASFVVLLLSTSLLNNSAQIPKVYATPSVHLKPQYIEVVIEQTPNTVLVVIVANFNETGVSMNIGNVSVDAIGYYTVEVNCIRVSGPTYGSLNLSVWTTLGIPSFGSHKLYVMEPSLELTLAEEDFDVVSISRLFSGDIVADLEMYMNYTQAASRLVPPTLYNYARLFLNSTTPFTHTLGMNLTNTTPQTIQDINLTLHGPLGVSFSIVPDTWIYGDLSVNESKIGYFNITTQDVPIGCYNLNTTLEYTTSAGRQTVENVIPTGIYLIESTWIASTGKAIVTSISPFNDNGTSIFYNYTTFTTDDGYDFTIWQDYNSTFTLSNFTGSLDSPFWGIVVGAAISAGVELFHQKVVEGKAWEDIEWGKVAVEGAVGAVTSILGGAMVNGLTKNLVKAGADIAKVKKLKHTIDVLSWTETGLSVTKEVVEGLKTKQEVKEIEGVDTDGNPVSPDTIGNVDGTGDSDPNPSNPYGSNVQPPPPVPEFPGTDISIFAATLAFLTALYFILKRNKQLPNNRCSKFVDHLS